jgi:hypothetical protein
MAMLEKTYDCLQCKAPIKLEKRAEGGWNKFNLDGTAHVHPPKNKGQQQQQQQQEHQKQRNSPMIGAIFMVPFSLVFYL